MPTLRKQLILCTCAQLALWGTMGALVSGFSLFGYHPAISQLDSLNAEMAAAQRQIARSNEKASAIPQLAAEIRSMRAEPFSSKSLSKSDDLALFLKNLSQQARELSVKLEYAPPDPPVRGELFWQQQIKLRLEGSSDSIFALLRRIEATQQLTRTRSVEVRRKSAGPGAINVEIALNVYFAPEE
jgi:Tfp pilus assembly protein PilO